MEVEKIVSRMTLEEKARLCGGRGCWHTQPVERLGIPAIMIADGPHGLRMQTAEDEDNLGINQSAAAVCFPAGCATASSFDRELVRRMGVALGEECQAQELSVLLGPAVNIKRSPLCGRNFEYYSEDPCLAGQIAAAFIEGVQSREVGTSLKHFAVNNQEHRRMSVSAQVDERTLREIYLAAFETPVRQQKPWTVMCSYNKVNGIYSAENREFLTDILRGEWGFDGFVVSDWGAVNKRVEDLEAGLDLEMPGNNGCSEELIIQAVRDGRLREDVLDRAVGRLLNVILRCTEHKAARPSLDLARDHQLAQTVAEESIVLLKNDGLLPLDEKMPVAFIGQYAKLPRYQGGGSSHVNSFRVDGALEAAAGMENVEWAQGFSDETEAVDETLLKEAVLLAKKVQAAVVFAGLPEKWESEGFDRQHMRMPQNQNRLIQEIAAVQPNTVVVLHNGGAVEMPWADKVKGIVETYLGGEAVGKAVVNILFGRVNPSGHLAETFPRQLEDNPSYLTFPGEKDISEYREGIFVGYRYYQMKKMPVLFPFGHGLSYTTFEYKNMRIDRTNITAKDSLRVLVDLTNTGKRAGKEAVQLYVSAVDSRVQRPVQELRGFQKVHLAPGETRTIEFELSGRSFSYWETSIHEWYAENGRYEICIGASSADIRVRRTVTLEGSEPLPLWCTMDTIVADIAEYPKAMELLRPLLAGAHSQGQAQPEPHALSDEMLLQMFGEHPLHDFVRMCGGRIKHKDIDVLIERINEKLT